MRGSIRRAGVLIAAASCAVLMGCSAPDDGVPALADWAEPGWMAQVRQANEAHQNAMIACHAEYGLDVVPDIAGGRAA